MRVAIAFISAATIVLCVASAQADEEYDACMRGAKGQNLEFGRCGQEWLDRENGRLHAIWNSLMEKVTDRTKESLIAEQGAWTGFKEQACDFYGWGEWGREGVVIDEAACKARIIRERAAHLSEISESVRQ